MALTDAPRSERFEIVRRLGEGGMGVVYEALDRERGQRVALKTLRTLDADALLLFKTEFRALQGIHHPNLISLGELIEDAGQWFFTMELIVGSAFLRHVRPHATAARAPTADTVDEGRTTRTPPSGHPVQAPPRPGASSAAFDEARLRAAFAQLAQGLCELHAAGKVHRDVKPSNVLVTDEGRVVLLDFGVIGEVSRAGAREEAVVGTAHYMAPEQAAAGVVSPEADWYSLGVVLYQALTGHVPLTGLPAEVIERKQLMDAVPPRTLCPEIPEDLDALCCDLMARDHTLRPGGAEVLRRLRVVHAEHAARRAADDVFVGRAAELAELRAAFADSARDAAVMLVIHGESGVGKSALVRHFIAELATTKGAPVILGGRCYEREAVPFKAFDGVIDALSRHLRALPAAEIATLLSPRADLLAQAFPVLRRVPAFERPPAAPSEDVDVDARQLRSRLFAAVRDLFSRLARQRPLVIVIDDLQWADADSLALLVELTRPPGAPPLLLLATARATSTDARGAPFTAQHIPGDVRHLHVEGLRPADAQELAQRLLAGAQLSPDDAAAIALETAGHPLFMDELIRRVRSPGGDDTAIRLDDALWARVRRLEPAARHIIELVAVSGVPIEQDIAARAVGCEFAEFAHIVGQLRAANLVRTTGGRRIDAVEAYHDRVREAVMANLAAERTQSWHGKLALALEDSGSDDAERIANHWLGAGNQDRATDHTTRAAAQAMRAFAFARAAVLYQRALDAPLPAAVAQPLRVQLGDALANAGRPADAAAAYQAVDAGTDVALRLALRYRIADQLLRAGKIDAGAAALKDALLGMDVALPASDRGALLSFLWWRARARLGRVRLRDPATLPPRSLERIDACCFASMTLGLTDTLRGAALQARHVVLALSDGDPERVARALAIEAGYVASFGYANLPRANRLLARVRELEQAQPAFRPVTQGYILMGNCMVETTAGRWRASRALSDRAAALFESDKRAAFEWITSHCYALAADFYLGDLAQHAARLRRLTSEADARGDVFAATSLRMGNMNVGWLTDDDIAGARAALAHAHVHWGPIRSSVLQHYFHLQASVRVDLYAGDGASAWHRITDGWPALQRARLLGVHTVAVEAHHCRAQAALAAHAAAPSPQLLAEAERSARVLARPGTWSAGLAGLIRAAIAHRRGDPPVARRLLAAAIAELDRGELPLFAAAARWREGDLLGGEAGAAQRAAAEAVVRAAGAKHPAGMVGMLAPGF